MIRVLLLSVVCLAMPAYARGQDLVVPARLSLDEALRLANERNPNLLAARNSVEIAEAQRVDAHLRPNPAISFESGSYPLFDSPRPNFWNTQEMTFRLDQEIELGGRRGLRTQAADAGVSVAEAGFRDVRRKLEFNVRTAYFAVVLARADLEVARTALEEIDRVIGLMRARNQQGEISGGELRRIQVERLKFVDDVFAAELALRNGRGSLLALLNAPNLGVEFETVETLSSGERLTAGGQTLAPARPPLDVDSLRAQALASRPDLLAAQREVQRLDTETSLQRALRTPNLTVGGGYRRDFGTNAVVFGITLPLPIASRNQGGLARIAAEQRQAGSVATAVAVGVSLDVQQAINAVDINRARVQYIEREYITTARESRDIVLAAYRLGTADLIDFFDAQRAFRDTARTYNRALYDERVSTFALAAAIGAPSIQP